MLELEAFFKGSCPEFYKHDTYFMSMLGIGLPTLPVVSVSGHMILVTMQVASVIPVIEWLRVPSITAQKISRTHPRLAYRVHFRLTMPEASFGDLCPEVQPQ